MTAAQLLLDLGAQDSARSLDRRLRYYTSRPLLCDVDRKYLQAGDLVRIEDGRREAGKTPSR